MSAIDEFLANNERYAGEFDKASLSMPPLKKIAVLACMDARMETGAMLGLAEGDAHVIRNAGGVVTDDVIRSLAISQRLLGTREIMVVHHTDCGMLTFRDDEVREQIAEDVGYAPPFALMAFSDLEKDVRASVARIKDSHFVPHRETVRGFIYEVETGRLREVD